MSITIDILSSDQDIIWDDYVKNHADATIFHSTGWRDVVRNVCGYSPHYILAHNSGKCVGVLPLFHFSKPFLGNRLISVPWAVRGGICADNDHVAGSLLDWAIELTRELNADYLELRGGYVDHERVRIDNTYYDFVLDVEPGPDQIFKNLRKSLRKDIRRSFKNDLRIDFNASPEAVEEFYDFHVRDMRRAGTPVQPYDWFRQLFRRFADYHTIARVFYGNKIVSMFLVRYYKNTVTEVLGNDLHEYRYLYPNIFMEWKLIEWSYKEGYRYYNFGRSIPESGTFFFKKGWRAIPVPLRYGYYYHKKNEEIKTHQASKSRKGAAKIWKRLPLWLTKKAGPVVRKQLP